ncbi:MAG TPA: efflux RND transporter periplasmic adaptor subunit [Candidatus Paceibacterota bacterium]|nr:efflux RND transporter periplasmic adaptor subunit [Candidatus Paceibacterota bacterium]
MKKIITRLGFGKRGVIITVVAVAVVGLVAYFFVASKSGGKYQFVSVARGTITEVVSVTGNTTPIQSLDLSFPSGGTVAAVYKNAGDTVSAGSVLVRLDTSALQAQLAQAQASVDAAQATLEGLQAGPTPQAVQVSQTALATAEQTLANTYTSIPNAVTDAYAKANDAVRNQVSDFYNNPDSGNPQLSFAVNDPQAANDADTGRAKVGQTLTAWQAEIGGISATTPSSTLSQALQDSANYLSIVTGMLNADAVATVDEIGLSASTVATYKNDVASGITEVSSAASAINTIQQNISSEQAAVAQAQAQLNQTLAGSTAQAIAAQEAQVEQAQANVQSINVSIANATLSSPINGVVTVQNAKVGQTAVAGQTITSIISGNDFEVDAYVPETDIGKVSVGDAVSMTFDAFPGETFTGKVFYIDPAETIQSGVVDYLVKVSFDTPDARVKSGLTANLDIETQTDQNALILPQYAIIQNASGTYVDIVQNGTETQVPVTLGIHDQNGNVEVVSGVTEGEQVVNIGLKAQ